MKTIANTTPGGGVMECGKNNTIFNHWDDFIAILPRCNKNRPE